MKERFHFCLLKKTQDERKVSKYLLAYFSLNSMVAFLDDIQFKSLPSEKETLKSLQNLQLIFSRVYSYCVFLECLLN